MTNIVKNKNGIKFDIDAIATDLNGKMDRDCLNRSDAGSGVMANMAMPDYSAVTTLEINTPSEFDAWWWGDTDHYQNWSITLPDGSTTRLADVSSGGINSTCFQFFPKGTYYTYAYENYKPKLIPIKGQS